MRGFVRRMYVWAGRFCMSRGGRICFSGGQGTKKGIPLYPNLVNLKSNTMKNTMQK